MAVTYYFASNQTGTVPAISGMASTSLCNDNSSGDTTTYPAMSATVSGAPPLTLTLYGYVTVDLGAATWIDSYSLTYATPQTFDPATPGIAGKSATAVVKASADSTDGQNGTWVTLGTHSLSSVGPLGGAVETFSGSVTATQYTMLRVEVTAVGKNVVTMTQNIRVSDFRASGSAPPPNQIPQCSTRTFNTIAPATMITSALWEIQKDGVLLDFGDRYDRFGPGGWGVVYPGFGGSGTVSITAPGGAPIDDGYSVRLASASCNFEVTLGTCPGSDPNPGVFSPMFIFSTGRLYTARRLVNPTLTRVSVGSPPAATNALANAFDASPNTTVDTTYTNGSNRQYLRADFGASTAIGSVLLRNATSAGTIAVYVSNSAITDGNFSGATALVTTGTQPVTNGPLLFLPNGVSTVSGRYVYIVSATAAMTVGDIDIRGERIQVGAIQNGNVSFLYENVELRDACWIDQYPIADKQLDPVVTLTAQSGVFVPGAVELLTGATLTDNGTYTTLTAGRTNDSIRFNAELTLKRTDDKFVTFTLYECIAPGINWQLGRKEFGIKNFQAHLRLSDSSAVPWRIEFDN